MAIVFQNKKYNLSLDSNCIIGVMGIYNNFFASLVGDDIYYIDKRVSVSNKNVSSVIHVLNDDTKKILKDLKLSDSLFKKKINELSHSEQKLLKYILMVLSNKKIIIIDEPFMDLDYSNKKRIILLLNRLVKEKKTIIIGSNNSNIIYSICKKALFMNDSDYYYGDISIFKDQELRKKYNINVPYLIQFVDYARNKKIKINYSRDIRDLIKDVYRNVS